MTMEPLGEIKQDTRFLWGARAIAAHLGIKPRKFYYLMEQKRLQGVTRIGSQYVATVASIMTSFPEASDTRQASDGVLSASGHSGK